MGRGGRGGRGGGGRGRGGGGRGKKKAKKAAAAGPSADDAYNKMSREERRHLKEYGEIHPETVAARDGDAVAGLARVPQPDTALDRLARKRKAARERVVEQPEASEESEEDEVNPYELLISGSRAAALNAAALKKQRLLDSREADVTARGADTDSDDSDSAGSRSDSDEHSGPQSEASEAESEGPGRGDRPGARGEGEDSEASEGGDSDGSSSDGESDAMALDKPTPAADEDSAEEDEESSADDAGVEGEGSVGEVTAAEAAEATALAGRFAAHFGDRDEEQIAELKDRLGNAAAEASHHKPGLKATSREHGPIQFTAGSVWAPPDRAPVAERKRVAVYTPPEAAVHPRIAERVGAVMGDEAAAEFFGHLSTYRDVLYPSRSIDDPEGIMRAYTAHAVNHVLKARAQVLRNSKKVKKDSDQEYRDQGFTRPTVLILAPYKSVAHRIVTLIAELAVGDGVDPGAKPVRNRARFESDFGAGEDDPDEAQHPNGGYRAYFDGNCDDCFRVGMNFTRTTMNLYTDFYHSDIIVASPLGLRLIVGSDGEERRDFDFLSSIELLVVDQAESLLMQNWQHTVDVVNHINNTPTNPSVVSDFTRVRQWALEVPSMARFFRQTVVLSAFAAPELNRLSRGGGNYEGCVEFRPQFTGQLEYIPSDLHQAFHRIECTALASSADERFEFFVKKVLPEFTSKERQHIFVYIESYFDFVRLRNHFRREEMSFAQICEYTSTSNVSRARSYLFHGERQFMLYTGRFHYHNRPRLRGIKHVIFYGLPQYAEFYPELLSYVSADDEATVTALYTKYDALCLQRIVGTKRTSAMLKAESSVHVFV